MPFITSRDGTRLKYDLVGDGPPLLLQMGAGCDSTLWHAAGYLEPLAREYRCIVYDHRGHGESDRPRGAQANHVDRYADDVITMLDHLRVESVAFLGYSFACAVGLRAADRDPSRLRCLIAIGGVVRNTPPDRLPEIMAETIAEHREFGWEKLIAYFEEQEGQIPEWMKQRIRATDVEPLIGWYEARPRWGWTQWEALGRVTVPTLFIVGEYEDPEDRMAEAAAMMRQGRRVRVPGTGHINAYLDSTFVLPHVKEFLRATTGRAD